MSRVPIFDADNHLYETRDAFTKFLPDRYKSAIRVRRGSGTYQDRGAGTDQ